MKKLLGLGIWIVLTLPNWGYAKSSVYLTNLTRFNLPLKLKLHGAKLEREAYRLHRSRLAPRSSNKVLAFNRDSGITAGKEFFFQLQLLEQQQIRAYFAFALRGKTIGSQMWQSMGSPLHGFKGWSSDRRRQRGFFLYRGRLLQVDYHAYFTGGDDNLHYKISEVSEREVSEQESDHIKIMAYNLYLRPENIFINGQGQRVKKLPAYLAGNDVLVLSEVFDDSLRKRLIRSLRKLYPYWSEVVGKDGVLSQDGGVIIGSRWPIVREEELLFGDKCRKVFEDCFSDKGAKYVKIKKGQRYYHVFGTHLQAGASAADDRTRLKQLVLIKKFSLGLNIPERDAVFYAGDFNIPIDKRPGLINYRELESALDAQVGQWHGSRYSVDRANDLVDDGPNETVDYVLVSRSHRFPEQVDLKISRPRALQGWRDWSFEKRYFDLSDHYPVTGSFNFNK